MTTIFFVRHAAHRYLGHVLVGRMPGVRLGYTGHEQALRLAERLKDEKVTAVQSSPRERACETASPIAASAGLPVEIASALDEIDIGEWTGKSIADLHDDPHWRRWNTERGRTRPPRGESMRELQRRVVAHLESLRSAHPDGRMVLVSHAEVIRAAVLHCLEMPLDEFGRIEIAPATISTIGLDHGHARLVGLNEAVST